MIIGTNIFRLYTSSSKYFKVLFKSPKYSDYHKVYKNNMDEDSFIGLPNKALHKVIKTPKSAYLHSKLVISYTEEYQSCKIEFIPWEQNMGSISIPITKSSPYTQFMKQVITDLYTNGVLVRLQRKWLEKEQICQKTDASPISSMKVISSFIWIMCGMTVSILTFFVEKLLFKVRKHTNENISESSSKDAFHL